MRKGLFTECFFNRDSTVIRNIISRKGPIQNNDLQDRDQNSFIHYKYLSQIFSKTALQCNSLKLLFSGRELMNATLNKLN